MKLLFLDIDGVLNSHQSHHYYNRMKNHSPEMEDRLCPIATSNLQHILEQHLDCFIVVSSTWRKHRSVDKLKEILAKYGISDDRIIDKTPDLDLERGQEIEAWLNSSKLTPSHFVILDDDSDMGIYLNSIHFVKTSRYDGLTWSKTDQVLKYFGDYTLNFSELIAGKSYRLFSRPTDTPSYFFDGKDIYYLDENKQKVIIYFDKENDAFAQVD